VVNGAVDPIDGTGKTIEGLPSAITSLVLVNGPIAKVPDGRFEKVILPEAVRGLSMADPFEKIAQGISDAYKVTLANVNTFMLERDCHPFKDFAERLGINPVLDKDGDLMPAITANMQDGLMVNNQPLHSMFGNSGGAAEFLLGAIPAMWLGGEAFGRLVSDTMKTNGWDRRFEYTPDELEAIKQSGLQTERIYPITELVPTVKSTDGVAAFGAITDNWHLPYHQGVKLGNGFAEVDVLKIGASGAVLLRRLVFTFDQSNKETAELFRPVLIRLSKVNEKDLRGELRNISSNTALSDGLKDEFQTAYYDTFILTPEGKMSMIPETLKELAGRDQQLVQEMREIFPDWFVA
jgi:fructose-1,6-bisphosphatase/sedoheptulose 1,7-bisphosphatase-like protein